MEPMGNKNCRECSEYRNCKDSFSSWIFFIIGIIATIAVRVVTVLIHLDPVYAKLAWYIGIGGFLAFFVYKFKVNQLRSKLIRERGLMDKITNQKRLSEEDYGLIGSLLCSLSSKKETINYFLIFAFSALALVLALYIDFFK